MLSEFCPEGFSIIAEFFYLFASVRAQPEIAFSQSNSIWCKDDMTS
jgi:hypothetical protein